MNPTFYIHVAIGTALILIIALFLGIYPKKKKQYQPSAYWSAKQYRMHLYACIVTCNTHAELKDLRKEVDKYMNKQFSDSPSRWKRKRYRRQLVDAYYLKQIWLNQNTTEFVCQS